MDSALKQRLVGAAVLVALGVIFIPMLLERGAEDSRLSVKMEIPPRPNTEFKDRTQQDEPSGEIEPLPPIEQSVASVKADQDTGDKAAGDESKSSAGTKQAESKQPKAVEAKPEPKPDKPAEAAEGDWIVQVGSFSRRTNAEVLRDKLKSNGFNAFMESAKTDTGPVYRVRVGPQKKRADAESLVKRLSEKGGYRGIVMSYSP